VPIRLQRPGDWIRILVISPLFPPEIGGPSTYVVPLARGLSSRGHKIEILTLAEAHPKEKYGLEVFSVLHKEGAAVRETRLLKSIISRARNADVIYALDVAAIGMQSILAGKLLGKPVLVRYAGDTAWEKARREKKSAKELEPFLRSPDANKLIVRLERFVLKNAAAVITPSRYLKRVIVDNFHIPEGRVHSINNAVEDVAPLQKKNFSISYGRFVPWKHFDRIIEAFAGIPKEKLMVVGEGPLAKELEAMAEGKPNISIAGKMPHKELMSTLAESKIFILNSSYEGMAHSILEAFAAGTPVIASDIEPNRELIKDGLNGILVPLEPRERNVSAIREAVMKLRDKEFADMLARNGGSKLKDHSWPNIIRETEEVLLGVAPRRNPRTA